jgi:uncharacterized protein YjbJ (UPF0337 family)
MNKDQVKGAAKETAGKIQKEFGKAVDSPKHTIEGTAKEVTGKVQKKVGDMKEDDKKQRDAERRSF